MHHPKKLWLILCLILCVGLLCVYLNQEIPSPQVSDAISEELAQMGLDMEKELAPYPETILTHLTTILKDREFHFLYTSNENESPSSPPIVLAAYPDALVNVEESKNAYISTNKIPSDQLRMELFVIAVMNRENSDIVENIRILGAYQWSGSNSLTFRKDSSDIFMVSGPSDFFCGETLSFFAIETTPLTRFELLRAEGRMDVTDYDLMGSSGVGVFYPYQNGSGGVISLGIEPRITNTTLEDIEGSQFQIQLSHRDNNQNVVSGNRLKLNWHMA